MNVITQQVHKFQEQTLVFAFLKKRDDRAFLKLYRRYTPGMYQLALRLSAGNTNNAEEVVQEAWARAIQKLSGFRWESSFRTWINAIVAHCCQEQIRRYQRVTKHIHNTSLEAPKYIASTKIENYDLERAISRLPDGYRQILVLHDIEGYTHQEIGEVLGITAGTSKSQLFNARRAVRTYLQTSSVKSEGEPDARKTQS